MAVMGLNGCADSGNMVSLRLHDTMNAAMSNVGTNLSVAVSGFDDQRPPSGDLGMHAHLFGGVSYFELMDGKLGHGVTKAFVQFLQQSGFQTTVGKSGSADVQITGHITKFSANATGQVLATQLQFDTIIEFTIVNKADGSIVRMMIGSGGTDTVLFVAPKDLETLMTKTLQENFELILVQNILGSGIQDYRKWGSASV